MEAIFGSIDLLAVGNWVASTGMTIIGIALTFKAIGLGRRAMNDDEDERRERYEQWREEQHKDMP